MKRQYVNEYEQRSYSSSQSEQIVQRSSRRVHSAALYYRLSRDDGGDAESNSIQTQRLMLRKYALDHGLVIFDEYVDDGISGTTFERPSFKRMIADIENGKVDTVVIKDLSRLGRNNAMTAFYSEIFFPDHDTRLIAINDGIDSAKGDNEIMRCITITTI